MTAANALDYREVRPDVDTLEILYVEDNADAGIVMRGALTALYPRWRVEWVQSLDDARHRLRDPARDFDAAIVDLGLPDADSDEAPLMLRAHHPMLPVVVLTGRRCDKIADNLIREGVQEFLVKGHATPDQVARSVRSAVERNARQKLLEAAALRDHLTGALNRQGLEFLFTRTVQIADRRALKVGVMVSDMNQFKLLNDTFGHATGDAILRHFVDSISSAIRPEDGIARLGGDEFAIVTTGLKNMGEASRVAERLAAASRRPCTVGGEEHAVIANFGMAVYPDHGTELDDLIRRADAAMYQAKKNAELLAIAT